MTPAANHLKHANCHLHHFTQLSFRAENCPRTSTTCEGRFGCGDIFGAASFWSRSSRDKSLLRKPVALKPLKWFFEWSGRKTLQPSATQDLQPSGLKELVWKKGSDILHILTPHWIARCFYPEERLTPAYRAGTCRAKRLRAAGLAQASWKEKTLPVAERYLIWFIYCNTETVL